MGELQVGDPPGLLGSDERVETEVKGMETEAKGMEMLGEKGDVESVARLAKSPEKTYSDRKKSLRSVARLAKTRPKSPLLRMAEMRKGGLRGRALRLASLKGVEGSEMKGFKGKKRAGESGLKALGSISEGKALPGGSMEVSGNEKGDVDGGFCGMGSGGEGILKEDGTCSGEMGVSASHCDLIEKGSMQMVRLPEGHDVDLVLDLVSSQPLQEMEFMGKQGCAEVKLSGNGGDDLRLEPNPLGGNGKDDLEMNHDLSKVVEEEFPPLSKDNLRSGKGKETFRGAGGKEMPRMGENRNKEKSSKNNGGPIPNADGNKWPGGNPISPRWQMGPIPGENSRSALSQKR